jgi:SSS family transporter
MNPAESFGVANYFVLAGYMIVVILVGVSFSRNQTSLAGYFLAERSAPWWAVGISILACDLSAISYLGGPAWTYYDDLRYPMSAFLYPFIAIIVAILFIPFLARLKVFTIYEYLEYRFGLNARLFASGIFLLQRASHMAIAIFAISLALQQIVGWPVWACVLVVGGLTTIYTVLGGMKAVLWTDVMQFFVLIGGMLIMVIAVLWSLNGDVAGIWRVSAEAGHTKMLSAPLDFWTSAFWKEMSIWGIVLGLLFYQVGAYGSDQVLVQRYLAAGSARLMMKSLIFSGFLTIPVMVVLYLLGLGFFAFYHAPQNAELLASLNDLVARTNGDKNMVLPHFVRHVLPPGLAGLVFAGLFAATMSVFSSGLNSLATATCMDFITRLRRSDSPPLTLRGAQWITFCWGVIVTMAAVGVYFAQLGSLLAASAAVIAFFCGPLLAMFLLGIFTTRVGSTTAIASALCGFTVAIWLWHDVSFIWWSVIECVPALIVGYAISLFFPRSNRQEVLGLTVWGYRQPTTNFGASPELSSPPV